MSRGPSNFEFRADLGAGDDRLTISGFDPQPDPPLRSVSFDIDAGTGDDAIVATFACPADPSFHFRANLGAGNDRLNINWEGPEEAGRLDTRRGLVAFDIHAGAGDDEITAVFVENPTIQWRSDLGAGNDRLNINWEGPEEAGRLDTRRGPVSFDIHAGAGDDEITAAFIENPTIQWRSDLGAGHDRLNINWAPEYTQPNPGRVTSFDVLAAPATMKSCSIWDLRRSTAGSRFPSMAGPATTIW